MPIRGLSACLRWQRTSESEDHNHRVKAVHFFAEDLQKHGFRPDDHDSDEKVCSVRQLVNSYVQNVSSHLEVWDVR